MIKTCIYYDLRDYGTRFARFTILDVLNKKQNIILSRTRNRNKRLLSESTDSESWISKCIINDYWLKSCLRNSKDNLIINGVNYFLENENTVLNKWIDRMLVAYYPTEHSSCIFRTMTNSAIYENIHVYWNKGWMGSVTTTFQCYLKGIWTVK